MKLVFSRVWACGMERVVASITNLLSLVTVMVDNEKNRRGHC